jgi:hypothetical protein
MLLSNWVIFEARSAQLGYNMGGKLAFLSLNGIIKGMAVRRTMWEITVVLALPNLCPAYVNTKWLTRTRQLKARGLIAGHGKLASEGANIAS